MKFQLIDQVLERTPTSITAVKNVTAAEEYLGDHFPGFPVLPGVFMLEALTQAARELLKDRGRLVLGQVKAFRYGSFVRPGEALKVEVTLPHLGALRIVGSQWGQDLSLQVSHGSPDNTGHVNWQLLTPKLLEELKLSGITDVKVAPFHEAAPGTDQQDSSNV